MRSECLQPLIVLVLLSAAPAAFSERLDLDAICRSASKVAEPSRPRITEAEAKALQGCDAADLYYGFTREPDKASALKCALIEGDGEILMSAYANGEGVERNLDWALKLSCSTSDAPAEIAGRAEFLVSQKRPGATFQRFNSCDFATSGLSAGTCAGISRSVRQREARARIARLQKYWPQAQIEAFKPLEARYQSFVDAEVESTVEWQGTGAAGNWTLAKQAYDEAFTAMVVRASKHELPRTDGVDLQTADRALNAIYQKLMKTPWQEDIQLSAGALKEAQRAWIRFRDDWMHWIALDPKNDDAKTAWLTFLTQQRQRALSDLATSVLSGGPKQR